MKTIGVIGGIGPQATIAFQSYLHQKAPFYIPPKANGGYPPLWVSYLREAPILIGADGKPAVPHQPSKALLDTARTLGSVAEIIVITSNSPHIFIKEIEEAAGKPVINLIQLVVEEVKKRKVSKVGIMGISGSIKNGLYATPFAKEGIGALQIPEQFHAELDAAIFKVMEGQETDLGKAVAKKALEYLRENGCEAIVLGCTEIPFLLDEEEASLDLINPLKLLADEVLRQAI